MARRGQAHGAHLGIALDGDADRVILVDENGKIVDGDSVMAICATRMLARGELTKKTRGRDGDVATSASSARCRRSGGKLVRTAVGDRYVVEEMRKRGYNLGGEQSGHLVFLDHATTGDGIAGGAAACWR